MTTHGDNRGSEQRAEVTLVLEPTTIAEWDVRDLLSGAPSAGLALATRDEAGRLLDDVALSVPAVSDVHELADFAGEHGIPLSHAVAAESERLDFHLMELPLGICVPAGRELTRLRLRLDAEPDATAGATILAYDVFPAQPDRSGEPGEPAPAAPAGPADVSSELTFVRRPDQQALGLRLDEPGQWVGQPPSVSCAERLANPVIWDVAGPAIGGRFTAYVIWRVSRQVPFTVLASLLGEVRGSESGHLRKAQFRSAAQRYRVGS